jgi:hypothetical protein
MALAGSPWASTEPTFWQEEPSTLLGWTLAPAVVRRKLAAFSFECYLFLVVVRFGYAFFVSTKTCAGNVILQHSFFL